MTQGDNTQISMGDLDSTTVLRGEVEQTQARIEAAEILAGMLRDWQKALPDAYASGAATGGPQTLALTTAIDAVVEAGPDSEGFGQALTDVRLACDQADAFGDTADAVGATGHTKGFQPA